MADTRSQSCTPTNADIVVSAPGKVILFGEHSVVYGRLALAASLGLRTRVSISSIDQQNILEINCPNLFSKETYELETLGECLLKPVLPTNCAPAQFNWETPDVLHHETLQDRVDKFIANHPVSNADNLGSQQLTTIKSMLYLITGILGSVNVELKPVSIAVSTDFEMGSGLGSSASYLVSIAAALVQYIKLNKTSTNVSKTGYKESNWDDIDMKSFSERELDIICNWAFCAEKIVHGTPSGLDNTICTYGSIVEFRKGLKPKQLNIKCPLEILLINTKVPRETKALVSSVSKFHDRFPDLVNNILNAMEDVAYNALKNIMKLSESEGEQPSQRACHDALGTLCSTNHHLLAALGVSHPRLDEAVAALRRRGLRAKLTGAGGGGHAFALLPPDGDPEAARAAAAELAARGFAVRRAGLAGDGVRVEGVWGTELKELEGQ